MVKRNQRTNKNMKLAEYQALESDANSRHATPQEREARKEALAKKLKSDPISGTVYVPVWFGSGRAKGAIEDLVAATKGVSKREAKNIIKASARKTSHGQEAYTDLDVARAAGEDCVGNGSITNYAVCESDLDAPDSCDISIAQGDGWRRA